MTRVTGEGRHNRDCNDEIERRGLVIRIRP